MFTRILARTPIVKLPSRLGAVFLSNCLLTVTVAAEAEPNHSALLVLQELSRIDKCTQSCPGIAEAILLAKQARCAKDNEKITCTEPNGKWQVAIDRAQFKNSLGKTVILRIDLTLPVDELRSIADLRREYFGNWDKTVITPPEHVLRPPNSIQLLGGCVNKYIYFGQTKRTEDKSVNSAILAIAAN